MSFPWGNAFASSSYSFSRSYHNSEIQDYIDSDEDPRQQTSKQTARKQPAKPKIPKATKSETQKKSVKTRDKYMEKIEFFSCKICKNTYNSKASLNRHFTTAHGLEKDVNEKKPKVVAYGGVTKSKALKTRAPTGYFRCNHCGKELTSEAFLQRHMATHNRPVQPKAKQTKNVSSTNINVNVFNTNNYYAMPSNSMTVGRSIWD